MSDSSKKMKMNEKEPLKFIDLNVDCLLGIFKYLSFHDFIELFRVHHRFHDLIALSLRKKSIFFKLNQNIKNYEDFLANFGDRVKELAIGYEGAERTMQLIQEYCNGGNVTKCKFSSVQFNDQFLKNNENLFNNLKSLTLDDVDIEHETFRRILEMCKGLKELDLLEDVNNFVGGIDYLLREIASSDIELLRLEIELDDDEIDLAPVSTKIKQLALSLHEDEIRLLEHFPCIQSLDLTKYGQWLPPSNSSLKMTHLKRLIIRIYDVAQINLEQFFLILADTNNLEELIIVTASGIENSEGKKISEDESFINSETVSIFNRMTKLKRLEFRFRLYIYNKETLLSFASHLKDLRVFQINAYDYDTDTNTSIDEIFCAFVERAKNLRKLSFLLRGNMHESSFYDKFYDKLCEIWEKQGRSGYLIVEISFDGKFETFDLQKQGKLIRMRAIQ